MATTSLGSVYRQILLEKPDVTSFLQAAYEVMSASKHSFSYAQFSKLAGFKARSYGRALVLGLKPVSLNAYLQLVKLFKFDKDHAEYLKLLIALTHKGFYDLPEDIGILEERMEKIRSRIIRRLHAAEETEKHSGAFSSRDHLIVYASLVATEEGVPFQQILKYTGIEAKKCRLILDDLVAKDLAQKLFKYDSYRSVESHLIGQKLGDNDVFMKAWNESAQVMLEKSHAEMRSRESLFLNSYLLVKRDKLEEFRTEMRDLLEKYLDHWCQEPGDEVVEVIVGATPVANQLS